MVPLDIFFNFIIKSCEHLSFLFMNSHCFLSFLFFKIQVISYPSFVDICFKRRLDSCIDTTNKWFIHNILISQVRHLGACRCIYITTHLVLFLLFSCLGSLNPGFILSELPVTLLCFALMLLPSVATLHVLFTLIN